MEEWNNGLVPRKFYNKEMKTQEELNYLMSNNIFTKFNPDTLKQANYREYYIYNKNLSKPADRFFQKRILDEFNQTKYFIDTYHYYGVHDQQDSVTFNVNFYRTNGMSFMLEISSRCFNTIPDAESFFEDFYTTNNCILDALNNDR